MSEPGHKPAAFVSSREVARLAGVSRSAVSRAFTPGASISDDTRAKVQAAADTLGYHVNHLARGLMRQQSGIVCLVVSDVGTPYLSRLLDRLSRRLQEAGKVAMAINAGDTTVNVEEALRKTLNYRADATVVLSGTPYRSVAQACVDSGQRLILLNRDDHLDGTINLGVDNRKAAEAVSGIFLRAGCRRPAVVASGARTPSLLARQSHFVACLEAAGLTPVVWQDGPTAYATGLRAGTELMGRAEPPDAIFAVTDLLACGVMDAARRRGLAIPQDVGIVGFDDIEQAGWDAYGLTTFRQPVDDIADWIVRTIEGDLDGALPDRLFEAPLVWRGSVRGDPPA